MLSDWQPDVMPLYDTRIYCCGDGLLGPLIRGKPFGPLNPEEFSGISWDKDFSEGVFNDCGVKRKYRPNKIIKITI